ncbi:MAG: hypothetical protein ACI9TY_000092 [Alphaproteobacteria bacterium]|jgi:hypothetical protein
MKKSMNITEPRCARSFNESVIRLSKEEYNYIEEIVEKLSDFDHRSGFGSKYLKYSHFFNNCSYPEIKAEMLEDHLKTHIENQNLKMEIKSSVSILSTGILWWKEHFFVLEVNAIKRTSDITDVETEI